MRGTRMRGRGAGCGTARAEIMIRTTEWTRAMGGGLSSGTLTGHVGLPTAEDSIVVIEVAQFRIHKAVNIDEGCLAVPDKVASVTAAQTRILTVVE